MSVLNSEVIDGMAVDINENALRLLIQKNTVVNIQENYKNEQVQLFAYSVNNSTRFQAHLKRHGVKIEKQFGLRGLIMISCSGRSMFKKTFLILKLKKH